MEIGEKMEGDCIMHSNLKGYPHHADASRTRKTKRLQFQPLDDSEENKKADFSIYRKTRKVLSIVDRDDWI